MLNETDPETYVINITHLEVLPILTSHHTEAVREGLAANSLATRGFWNFSHTEIHTDGSLPSQAAG